MNKNRKITSKDWRVNTPQLLAEISSNDAMECIRIPFKILKWILAQVAKRAVELNDKELNKLMLRLALYEVSNPESKEFNQDFVREYLEK